MELTAATALTALWAVTSYYFWSRDRLTSAAPERKPQLQGAQPCDLFIYASQSGQARKLSERYVAQIRAAAQQIESQVELRCISQVTPQECQHYRRIFFIVSTAGQGESPDSARRFNQQLEALPAQFLATHSVRFALLALGDSSYSAYCAYGYWLYAQLERLGGVPLTACVDVDRMNDFALLRWQRLLEDTFATPLSATDDTLACQLTDRRLLNPGSPNPALYWLQLAPAIGSSTLAPAKPGDIIDVHLPDGQTRSYSLANAPTQGPSCTLELIVRQHFRSDGNPGAASHYLTERVDGGSQIQISVRRGFDWQQVPVQCPLILIGAGSGLAGVRAGMMTRSPAKCASTWLIFGERSPLYDRPAEDELSAWLSSGRLSYVDRVWSQPQTEGQPRYVQDILHRHRDRLTTYLMEGGYIYVCGSAQGLGEGVDQTLRDLLGDTLVANLQQQGRYVRDIY